MQKETNALPSKNSSVLQQDRKTGGFSRFYSYRYLHPPPLCAFPALSGRVFGCARKEGAHLCETVKISVGNRINFQGSTGAVFAHFFFSGVGGGGKGREAFCIAQLMFGRMKIIASATPGPTGENGLLGMKVGWRFFFPRQALLPLFHENSALGSGGRTVFFAIIHRWRHWRTGKVGWKKRRAK